MAIKYFKESKRNKSLTDYIDKLLIDNEKEIKEGDEE